MVSWFAAEVLHIIVICDTERILIDRITKEAMNKADDEPRDADVWVYAWMLLVPH